MIIKALLAITLAVASTTPAPPVYRCGRAPANVLIDGKIEDAEWSSAAWTHDFRPLRGDAQAQLRTRAKLMGDEQFVYIAAEMIDPDIRAALRDRDAPLHQETAFEVFIDPDDDGQRYLELQVNPNGAVMDLLMSRPYEQKGKADHSFRLEKMKSAVAVEGTVNDSSDRDERWTVELAIPIDEIAKLSSKSTRRWRINLARAWHAAGESKGVYTAWSPTGPSLHTPMRWGWIEFMDDK